MRLNQLDGLMAFWKVAQHRGFTAAAADLEVSPSALSQAIRHLEQRLGVRLLNRTTRSVSVTEAGEVYLARIGPALVDVLDAAEQLSATQGRPAGTLRINAARISTALVLQPILAGFLRKNSGVRLEIVNDEGFVDIVERGFDAGIRLAEGLQRDMVSVPVGPPLTAAVVASPAYFERFPVPRHPDELARHDCIRFRFDGTGAIYRWEFHVDGKSLQYEVAGSLTVNDTLFSVDAALDGVGLAYTFVELVAGHLRGKRLKRVLAAFSPTFPGFHLYYPSRRDQPAKLRALIDYARTHRR